MDMGPLGIYLIFGSNGVQRGGMYIKPPRWPGPPNWLPYVHVPSVDEALRDLRWRRAPDLMAPMDVPGGGRIAIAHGSGGRRVCDSLVGASRRRRPRETEGQSESETQGEAEGEAQGQSQGQAEEGRAGEEEGSAKKKVAKSREGERRA